MSVLNVSLLVSWVGLRNIQADMQNGFAGSNLRASHGDAPSPFTIVLYPTEREHSLAISTKLTAL
jgi:hypothetical protein